MLYHLACISLNLELSLSCLQSYPYAYQKLVEDRSMSLYRWALWSLTPSVCIVIFKNIIGYRTRLVFSFISCTTLYILIMEVELHLSLSVPKLSARALPLPNSVNSLPLLTSFPLFLISFFSYRVETWC